MVQAVEAGHVPVMAARIVELLSPALADGGTYVDCTLGLAGHARMILSTSPHARLVGIDRDADALAIARERLAEFGDRVALYEAVYDELPDVLAEDGTPKVQAILADLGLSSLQIDRRERGFAYSVDAPLDMRMDPTTGPTAADVLNTYDQRELARVLREYGEERFAGRIAAAIVAARSKAPFETSGRLVELLYDAIPAPARRRGGHPAKRTFQALRIEVNDELAVLRRALPAAIDALSVGGRIVVESYQSGEDRLVKRALAAGASSDLPPDLPFVPEGHGPELRLVTRGAELAGPDEIDRNPRAASVRLRAAERIRPIRGVAS